MSQGSKAAGRQLAGETSVEVHGVAPLETTHFIITARNTRNKTIILSVDDRIKLWSVLTSGRFLNRLSFNPQDGGSIFP
jgi:hypothetical protein